MRVLNMKYIGGLALAAALLMGSAAPANAQAIITNGTVALGLNTTGSMNVGEGLAADGVTVVNPYNSGFVGLSFFTDYGGPGVDPGSGAYPAGTIWGDATSPGCLCEGWGVSVTGHSGFDGNGFANLTVDSFATGGGGTTATSVTHLTSLPGLTITHAYAPATGTPYLYEAVITITNTTGGDLADLRYRRVMDWDVPTTTFDELVTLQGVGLGNLIDSCTNGFDVANAALDCNSGGIYVEDTNVTDLGPYDHGASFTFGFGSLLAGASRTFSIFYGAAPSEAAAFAALAAVGAQGIYSFGQNSSTAFPNGMPATFIFGFGGVGAPPIDGGTAVPEPGTVLLLGGGLAALVVARRRSRKA